MNQSLTLCKLTPRCLLLSLRATQRLPVSQACGLILGYEVRLSYSEGGADLVNLTTAEPTDQLVCSEMRCHLNTSLNETSSVSVSAYNVHGATKPSYLTMPVTGISFPDSHKVCRAIR